MVAKTREEIVENCALGENCNCLDSEKPWLCENWARSNLACPAYVHGSGHYGPSPQQVESAVRQRAERHADHHRNTEKKLREIRHSDPRKHLRAKGVKI